MRTLMNTLLASVSLAITSEQVQAWTPEQMMQMKTISDVQLSPDNQSVLFVSTEPVITEEKSTYISQIFKADIKSGAEPTLFSDASCSCIQPRWSPDGKSVVYLKKQEGINHLFVVTSKGENAVPLVNGEKSVQTVLWSPDSTKIAFVMEEETESEKARKKTSAAYVYKQPKTINRLWLIDLFPAPSVRALTTDDYCVRGYGEMATTNTEFDWSPDGKTIAFAYSPGLGMDNFYLDSSLAAINLETGIITPWEKNALFEALPKYSPDGNWVAYVSGNSSKRYALNRQAAIRNPEGKNGRLLDATHNEGVFLFGPNLIGWTPDSKQLLFYEPKGTKYHISLLPIDGSPAEELPIGEGLLKEPALSYDRTHLGFVKQTSQLPPEACISKLSPFETKQISHFNKVFLKSPQSNTEVISWASTDGQKIEGLLTYPNHYQAGRQYPLLLVIHGGPMGVFSEVFLGTPSPYPLAAFAEAGFFILRPNPRGSTGYGKDFRCANYSDWGGLDFSDIMAGVDALIAKGIADPNKLGVMGWSYGGYMSAWTITQTDRFKAASIGAGLCNLVSMIGTTDLHRFMDDYIGSFTENSALFLNRSPINHIAKVTTPCIIQHGTEDKRVPVSQSYELYHALLNAGQKPTLHVYPGVEHAISDPKMILDAMKTNLEWFTKHL